MIRTAKVRALIACVALAVCFTLFSARLVQLQVCRHDFYTEIAVLNHGSKQAIYARRGWIEDVNGEPLAVNDPVSTAIADGSLITDPAAVAQLLAEPLGLDESELAGKLKSDRQFIVLKKNVAANVEKTILNRLSVRSLRGVYFVPDELRKYPGESTLCHIIGFMNAEHRGVEGIEKSMDEYLRGHDGFRYIEHDRTGREIVLYRGKERPARDGFNVRLTVDLHLQEIVETELADACSKYKPEKAIAILMRPSTGEILALANRPNFDLNDVRSQSAEALKRHAEAMKNAAVIDMIEPGSTFKIVTASAALNERSVRPDTMIYCENGRFSYAGRTLHDHHGYADLSVDDILMKSSNIGAAKLALRLGDQKFYEYIRRFGFGERTGVSLPGEISGLINPPHKWAKIDITRIAMGHSVGVTPLQSVTAMAAIANGGRLMMPQIVQEISDGDGNTIANFPPVEVRQVITKETAEQVRDALKNVVSDKGTAALAKVNGFTVAGKTGTAEKINPAGGYLSGKYVISFIGFMPADNPEFVGLVLLDDAKVAAEQNYGGQIAGPIFAHIAEKAARYLNLVPAPVAPPSNVIITQRGH